MRVKINSSHFIFLKILFTNITQPPLTHTKSNKDTHIHANQDTLRHTHHWVGEYLMILQDTMTMTSLSHGILAVITTAARCPWQLHHSHKDARQGCFLCQSRLANIVPALCSLQYTELSLLQGSPDNSFVNESETMTSQRPWLVWDQG